MAKNISQVHQAALAFRTQFRPLIELLDDIAELDSLENTRREAETAVATARSALIALEERRVKAELSLVETQQQTADARKQGEAQVQAVASDIAAMRANAEAEATRVRAEVSATIGKEQAEAADRLAVVEAVISSKQAEVEILNGRLEMLRKAIAGIVAGSEGA